MKLNRTERKLLIILMDVKFLLNMDFENWHVAFHLII